MKKLILLSVFFSTLASAGTPIVGREAAGKFFKRNVDAITGTTHFMAIHLGKFLESQAWDWGQSQKQDGIAHVNFGVTYKMGAITENETMDWHLRIELTEYDLLSQKPLKLSFLPMIIFPDVNSKFPIYFGGGAGLGVFIRQLPDESYLSLDYQMVLGARFFDIFGNAGFFVETGIKNHLQLLTNGQVNSTFLSLGSVFTF